MLESINKLTEPLKSSFITLLQTREHDVYRNDNAQYVHHLGNNLDILEDFIKGNGWPSQSLLSELGISEEDAWCIETSAFLCVQHADCNIVPLQSIDTQNALTRLSAITSRQEAILNVMKTQKAHSGFICYLTDRIARNSLNPQEYGTQYQSHPHEKLYVNIDSTPCPMDELSQEQIELLITKRQEAGLEEAKPWFQSRDTLTIPLQFVPNKVIEFLHSDKLSQTLKSIAESRLAEKESSSESSQHLNLHNKISASTSTSSIPSQEPPEIGR